MMVEMSHRIIDLVEKDAVLRPPEQFIPYAWGNATEGILLYQVV